MADVRSTRSPSRRFLQQITRDIKGDSLNRLLFRGVVTFVDRLGNEERPRFSVQAKVLGIDGPTDRTDGRWFPSLFPIHLIALPEVGEEILLICEEIGNINSAFWISRTVTQNTLTRNEIGAGIKDRIDNEIQPSSSQYGFDGAPLAEAPNEAPNDQYDIPDTRIKAGDVVIQGRSNTSLRQTFDAKNKAGYTETVTEEKPVADDVFYQDDFKASDGAREVLATKSDLDTQIIEAVNKLEFDPDFLKNGAKNKYDAAYLLLEAIELRIISRNGKKIQHAVLAEEQERWLILLIDIIRDLIDKLNSFRTDIFEQHYHMATGPTSPPLPPGGLTQSREIFGPALDKVKTDLENHKQPIPDHHSKTTALN